MPAPLTVDVALTSDMLPPVGSPNTTVYIVIDVIRATTMLCALFEHGARRVLVAPGIAEARTARERLGENYLLAGEVRGARPPGFDLGNSPSELAPVDLQNREILFATTNGTRALHACRAGRAVYAGAFRNAAAVTRAALVAAAVAEAPSPSRSTAAPSANVASEAMAADSAPQIVFVCSGRGAYPAYDDTLCAGYLVSALLDAAHDQSYEASLGENARIALAVWREVERANDLRAALASSDAGRSIQSIGLGADLAWCATIDATALVPALTNNLGAEVGDLLIMEPLV